MHPPHAGYVELSIGDEQFTLFHGDMVGRLWSAALHLNDARISEAHAMVSLRGREWKILALRGRFLVDGRPANSAVLSVGTELAFAPGLTATVTGVLVPEEVLAVEADGLARRVVTGVTSLFSTPRPRTEAGWNPQAEAWLWPTGNGWMRSAESPEVVEDGSTWTVGGTTFRASLDRTHAGVKPTEHDGTLAMPLRILARYDTVHIQRRVDPVLVLTGRSARLVSELVTMGQPCDWESLARQLWGEADRHVLRRRWDMQLSRLRDKLRASGVRTNLVRPDGTGLIELVLGPSDEVVDET